MPSLARMLLSHCAVGFALAGLFVAYLLHTNAGGLSELTAASDQGPLAVVLLFFFSGLTFASVQMGFAVMLSSHGDEIEDAKPSRPEDDRPL